MIECGNWLQIINIIVDVKNTFLLLVNTKCKENAVYHPLSQGYLAILLRFNLF